MSAPLPNGAGMFIDDDEEKRATMRAWLDRPPPPKHERVDGLRCPACEGRGHVTAPAQDYGWRSIPCAMCHAAPMRDVDRNGRQTAVIDSGCFADTKEYLDGA